MASSAARSCSGVPSIHSSVSTSRAVRSQSTAGTRKSGSSLVFSAISDSAAASSRRSISIATERRQRVDDLDQAQPPRLGRQALGVARREDEGVEIARKRRSTPGRSTFTATGLRPSAVATSARCTCAIEAAATGGPNDAKTSLQRLAERGRDHGFGLGLRERRHLVLQRFRDRARARRRRRRAASPGTGRA